MHLIQEIKIQKKIKKSEAFDLSHFIGKSYFDDNDSKENYLIFQPAFRYFKIFSDAVDNI